MNPTVSGLRDFDGLVAVVTGGASGIGLATARLLAERGARVACLDLNPEGLAEPLLGLRCDVADDAQVRSAVAEAAECFGGIDILVHNAGVPALGDVTAQSDEEWHRVLDVNVVGAARVTRAALPWLRRSHAAAIVINASAVARIGLPNRVLYSASKGALLAMSRAMAADFARVPIRVNCVTPGVVDTPWQTRAIAASADPEAVRRALQAFQPNGQMVAAEHVAYAIAYLASPLAANVTGAELAVDGGLQGIHGAVGSS